MAVIAINRGGLWSSLWLLSFVDGRLFSGNKIKSDFGKKLIRVNMEIEWLEKGELLDINGCEIKIWSRLLNLVGVGGQLLIVKFSRMNNFIEGVFNGIKGLIYGFIRFPNHRLQSPTGIRASNPLSNKESQGQDIRI